MITHAIATSAPVQGFGRRPIEEVRQARGPSSESLQGKNPREVVRGRAARYGDFGAGPVDVVAAAVAGGAMVKQFGDAARDARQRKLDANLSFAGLAG
jgi:hypothetical protein